MTPPPSTSPIVNVTSTAIANGRSVATELRDLKALHDAGVLTAFESQRAKLLPSLTGAAPWSNHISASFHPVHRLSRYFTPDRLGT